MGKFIDSIKSFTGQLKASMGDVRAKLEIVRRQREDLLAMPLPPDEVAALLCEVLDRRAADYEGRMLARVESVTADRSVTIDSPGLLHSMVLMGGHGASGQEIEAALAYLLRDQLRAALQKTLSERRAGKCAPPKAEREQLLAQMEAEIAALKRKEEDLLGDFRALQKEVEG